MQNIDFLFEGNAFMALQPAKFFLEDNLPDSVVPYLKEANIRIRDVSSPSCTFSIHSLNDDFEGVSTKPLKLITFDLTVAKLCGFREIETAVILLHEIGHTVNPYLDAITEIDKELVSELLSKVNIISNSPNSITPKMAGTAMSEIYADYFVKYCAPRYIPYLSKALDSVQKHNLAPGLEYITEIRKLALSLSKPFFLEDSILSGLINLNKQHGAEDQS